MRKGIGTRLPRMAAAAAAAGGRPAAIPAGIAPRSSSTGTIGLIILVAIPLPGTGAWTGALVADVLDLRLRTALPAIALGVLIAGIITTTVTCGVIRVFW